MLNYQMVLEKAGTLIIHVFLRGSGVLMTWQLGATCFQTAEP